ncbi:hypothetical protein BJ878DRAFT_186956 [Calycina marina]|uniref:DUF7730 domain-containing protein n=1 Tax=Calycina marina TaxID=1763456 RepID=A0A9P7Z8E1_9HELO|nr:hypothetical protein BJ878DRAFT_186956 [Calycina marina]
MRRLLPHTSMPISFFDLPREIRDIIYTLLLVSPNGHLTPIYIPQLMRRRGKPASSFYLQISLKPSPSPPQSPATSQHDEHMTLSLLRTSHQIHAETHILFWSRNIFSFPKPELLIATLKDMGQIPSRLIRTIDLTLAVATLKLLPKMLRLLASRSRHGAFKTLTLTVPAKEMGVMERYRRSDKEGESEMYDSWLEVLREGGKERGFDKRMCVERGNGSADGECVDPETVRELHLVWGGEMRVSGRLEWRNYVHVGELAVS